MKLESAKWKAVYLAANEDAKLKGWKASSGETCALASIRIMRDGVSEEVAAKVEALLKDKKPVNGETVRNLIKDSCRELIQSLGDVELKGFASNASAAMAFAGLKVESTAVGKILAD